MPRQNHQFWAYIGNNSSDGIGLFKLDADAGTLTSAGIAAPAIKPGFLAISPNQKFSSRGLISKMPVVWKVFRSMPPPVN